MCLNLFACSTPNGTDNTKKQPSFPSLGKYWVVDPDGYLELDTIKYADAILEQLRKDHIAEVAIVIQKGVKDNGPYDDELIWARDWGRYIELGDKEDRRAIVWLIRPDVDPEDDRIIIEISKDLTWLTLGKYKPIMEDAAIYANFDDFDKAVEILTKETDEVLRKLWNEKNNGGN
ncbi:MAG: TPM domain-containing protein [Candidatus Shapirobacteria bacterium]|nr:TPM domain-containing protein [Candidatus Shapirobacteria bacterium]